jgi:hypothetical protein
LVFKTRQVMENELRGYNQSWFYTKTKLGNRILNKMKEKNNNKWYILRHKLVGWIFIFVSLIALLILIVRWRNYITFGNT